MIVTLSHERMLGLWRGRAGLEPALAGASVERFDSLEIDTLLAVKMRAWYLELLDTAPLDRLDVRDVTSRVKVEACGVRCRRVSPGVDVRRVAGVELDGEGAVLLSRGRPGDARALRMLENPLMRHCTAVDEGDGTWTVYGDGALTVRGVMDPGDELYRLDERDLPAADFDAGI